MLIHDEHMYRQVSLLGIFDDEFIEERKKGLEEFLNKLVSQSYIKTSSSCRVAGHPLAQNERCLHMFLQEPIIDRNYVPGKVRANN